MMSYAEYLKDKIIKTKEYMFRTIQYIDKIRVSCIMEYDEIMDEKTNKMNYEINIKIMTNLYLDKYQEYPYLYYKKMLEKKTTIDIMDIEKCIRDMNIILKNLKYDKYNNELTMDRMDEPFEELYLNKEYNCSICYEPTLNRTDCNHRLCIQCWSKLEDMKCPCCRKENIYFNY